MRVRIIFILVMSVTIIGKAQTNDWHNRIISKRHYPLASLINPHVSPVNVLIIDGKRFNHVRGIKGFYLRVPKSNSIVFVVDEIDHSVSYHIFDMDKDQDIVIPARNSVFGRSIGFSNSEDAVEQVGEGKIVLSTRLALNPVTETRIYLDLLKKVVVDQKTFIIGS